jgi:MFS family permease
MPEPPPSQTSNPVAGPVAAMLATQALVSWAATAAPVLAPLAASDLGVAPHAVGYFVAIVYGTAALVGPASGAAIARFGAVRVSQACLVFSAVAMALLATGNQYLLLAAALAMGLGYGPATPASSQLLVQIAPLHRMNVIFSIKQTGVPLGNALAGAILPGAALAFGWRGAAAAVAVICLGLTLALQPFRARFDARQGTARFRWRAALGGPLALVWRTPVIRGLALVSFAYAGMQVSLSTFLVIYLHSHLGMDVVAAGLMLAGAQLGGVAGRIIWGLVADHWRDPMRVLGGLGLAMTAAAAVTGAFTPAWPWLLMLAVSVLFGATAVGWNGVYLAHVARLAPAGRAGEMTGGTSFFTFGGVMVAPAVVTGVLSAGGGYLVGFGLLALATLAGGAACLFFAATQVQQR